MSFQIDKLPDGTTEHQKLMGVQYVPLTDKDRQWARSGASNVLWIFSLLRFGFAIYGPLKIWLKCLKNSNFSNLWQQMKLINFWKISKLTYFWGWYWHVTSFSLGPHVPSCIQICFLSNCFLIFVQWLLYAYLTSGWTSF